MRCPPDHFPFAGAGPLPHPDPDLVPDQEPQHRMHGAQLLEQAEHQAGKSKCPWRKEAETHGIPPSRHNCQWRSCS